MNIELILFKDTHPVVQSLLVNEIGADILHVGVYIYKILIQHISSVPFEGVSSTFFGNNSFYFSSKMDTKFSPNSIEFFFNTPRYQQFSKSGQEMEYYVRDMGHFKSGNELFDQQVPAFVII